MVKRSILCSMRRTRLQNWGNTGVEFVGDASAKLVIKREKVTESNGIWLPDITKTKAGNYEVHAGRPFIGWCCHLRHLLKISQLRQLRYFIQFAGLFVDHYTITINHFCCCDLT